MEDYFSKDIGSAIVEKGKKKKSLTEPNNSRLKKIVFALSPAWGGNSGTF